MSDTNNDTKTTNPALNTLDDGRLEIVGELAWDEFSGHRATALDRLSQHVKIDGFRKGKIPEKVLEQHVGEMAILEEMAHTALSQLYPKLVMEHSIDAIGRPEILITKIAAGSSLGYKITTSVMPEIPLADYRKIVKKEMGKKLDVEVTDKDVDEAILQLRRMRKQAAMDQAKHDAAKDGGPEFVPTRMDEVDDNDLPELDDEYLAKLGKFENMDDFTAKLRENITQEKELHAKDKRRMTIIETIMEKTEVNVPEPIVNYEKDKMAAELKHNITMAGMEFDDYLKQINKTEDELRDSWNDDATKRAKLQLVVNKIATVEDIKPDAAKVDEQIAAIMKQYPDEADERRARAYVEHILLNQAVFEWLEAQK